MTQHAFVVLTPSVDPNAKDLVKAVTSIATELYPDLTYNTMIVTENKPMADVKLQGKGLALALVVGVFIGSVFVAGPHTVDQPGSALLFDSSGPYCVRAPRGSQVVILLYYSSLVSQLDAYDQKYLQDLGFKFRIAEENFACSAKKDDEHVFVHCCCEKGNLLSDLAYKRRMKSVLITAEDDFTKPETVDSVIKTLRGPGDMFFFSSLCTGGSTW